MELNDTRWCRYYLVAESAADMDRWVDCICRVLHMDDTREYSPAKPPSLFIDVLFIETVNLPPLLKNTVMNCK